MVAERQPRSAVHSPASASGDCGLRTVGLAVDCGLAGRKSLPAQASAFAWPPVPEELKLATGHVHVIGASLDLSPARLADLTWNLSADELARAARFYARRDRDRFIARRGLLRELLGRLAHAQPASLVFSTGAFGKPALAMPGPARSLQFSSSHSEALAVFAIGREDALGVDLEAVRLSA